MKTAVISLALLCAGCDNSATDAAGIRAVMEGCAKPVSVEVHLTPWGNEVTVKCDEAKPEMKK